MRGEEQVRPIQDGRIRADVEAPRELNQVAVKCGDSLGVLSNGFVRPRSWAHSWL